MSELQALGLSDEKTFRRSEPADSRWFVALTVHAIEHDLRLVTGDEETCAVLLAGTFDLQGGATAWPSRGARATPMQGRPVAVYLPPSTPFVAANGKGEILTVAARRSETPTATGHEALQHKPLLPLAGSGKAFDPVSGQWRPTETFATAAEHLTPRRIERLELDGATMERVFAADYKAATLTMDEVVLQADAVLRLGELALPNAAECLIYARGEGAVRVDTGDGQSMTLAGEAVARWTSSPAALRLTAIDGAAYAILSYAGK